MTWYTENSFLAGDFDQLSDLDFDSLLDDVDSTSTASFDDIYEIKSGSLPVVKSRVVKKSARKQGAKVGQKLLKLDSRTNMPNFQLVGLESINVVTAPNMSRRRKDLTLYAFPNFNKCDALLYFPSTMARHLNSGDYSSLADLFGTHFDKNCIAELQCGQYRSIDAKRLLELFEIANEMYPDSMMVMHATKVIDNEIRAMLYFKSTDNCTIYESVLRRVTDPSLAAMFAGTRTEQIKEKLKIKSEEERLTILSMVDSGVEVIVYGQLDLRLSFDADTKRVRNVKFLVEVTSVIQAQSC